jgi:hypothetical protein
MDLAKVVPVFFGPRAQEFRRKHGDAIHKLCLASAEGCAVRDLPALQALLEITLQLVADGLREEFEAPACALVEWVQRRGGASSGSARAGASLTHSCCCPRRLLYRPYVRHSSTDELKLASGLRGVLAAVGRVLEDPFPEQLQMSCAKVGGQRCVGAG